MYAFLAACLVVMAIVKAEPANRVRRETEPFQWEDCGSDPNRPMRFDHIGITPMPIEVPGSVQVSARARLTRDIPNMDVKFHLVKKTYFFNLPIMCIGGVGSCKYYNICHIVPDEEVTSHGLYQEMLAMFHDAGVQPSCPVIAQNLRIVNYTLTLPEMPSVVALAAQGTYGIKGVITANGTDTELGCFELTLSVTKKCTGWFCF